MVDLTLSLSYTLAPGWMTPFVEAVMKGEALARRCADCAKTSFPPQRTCSCGQRQGEWHRLNGEATVLYRTIGSDGDFALAQFDGADTKSTLRLAGFPPDLMRGTLIAPEGDLPALILAPREGP
ncbi:PhlB family protein [Gymnodinialimonas sp.]